MLAFQVAGMLAFQVAGMLRAMTSLCSLHTASGAVDNARGGHRCVSGVPRG